MGIFGGGKQDDVVEVLKKVPIFFGLSDSELKEIAKIVFRESFKTSETIFREGEPGAGMCIIMRGEVAIYRGKDTKSEEELARLKDGDFFGDMALLSEEARSATAIAVGETHIVGMYRPDLFKLFDSRPQLAFKILTALAEILAKRLRETTEELYSLRSLTSGKRTYLRFNV